MIFNLGYIKEKLVDRFHYGSEKKIIKGFAGNNGLVYLGSVNQKNDDHQAVRGLTVAANQEDDYYTVGTQDDYSIALVRRSEPLEHVDEPKKVFSWIIMSFDLHTEYRVPHFFIGAKGRDMKAYHALFSSFPNMIETEATEATGGEFTNRFTLFARPAKLSELEQIIDQDASRIMAAHFWPLSIEQHDNVLYLYAENTPVSTGLLTNMLKNGLWLVKYLDQKADNIKVD